MTVQTNDGRVHIADPAHVTASPAGTLTADLASEWGGHTDFISANPAKLQGMDAVIKAAGAHTGIYVKTNQDADGSMVDAAYSHKLDSTGKLVRRFIKRWNVYIPQPNSPVWLAKHVADLKALKAKYPWVEFFFMDSAGTYSFTADKGALKPGTKTPYTQAEWLVMISHNIDSFNAQVPMPFRVINGLQPETVDLYNPCIGMVEGAFGSMDGVLPTQAAFLKLLDQVWLAQSKGWTPWLYVKMRADHGSVTWDAFQRYCLPAAMIMDRGSLLYCQLGIEGAPPSWATREYLHPWYRPNIGRPLPVSAAWQDMETPEGGLLRLYERGAVIHNPTSAGIQVTMPDGTGIPLDAQSGEILESNTVTTWSPVA